MSEAENVLFKKIFRFATYVVDNGCTGPYSVGEGLAGALSAGDTSVLRRLGYTFDEAVERIGGDWCRVVFSQQLMRAVWNYKMSRLDRSHG